MSGRDHWPSTATGRADLPSSTARGTLDSGPIEGADVLGQRREVVGVARRRGVHQLEGGRSQGIDDEQRGQVHVGQPQRQRQRQIRQGARRQPDRSAGVTLPRHAGSGPPRCVWRPRAAPSQPFRESGSAPPSDPSRTISVIDRTPARADGFTSAIPGGQRLTERRRPGVARGLACRVGAADAAHTGFAAATAAASCRCASSVKRRRSSAAMVVTSQRRSPC